MKSPNPMVHGVHLTPLYNLTNQGFFHCSVVFWQQMSLGEMTRNLKPENRQFAPKGHIPTNHLQVRAVSFREGTSPLEKEILIGNHHF